MSDENTELEMIKIQTTRFGELEVPQSSVITVINGVIGFPKFHNYTLLEYNPPFSWLHSTENPDLAFVVVNAAEFGDGYKIPVPYGDRDIDLKEDDDIAIVNLVSIRPDPNMTTVNLKAPLVVNLRTMKARQLVLDDPRFPIRMPLWAGEENSELDTPKKGDGKKGAGGEVKKESVKKEFAKEESEKK